MSTNKPRITLSLEPHVYEVLRRLSAAGGHSMSAIVTGFLDVALPPMERMVVVMEAAKAAPLQTEDEVRSMVLRAEAKLLPTLERLIDQSDLFLGEELTRHRSRAGGGVAAPGPGPKALSTPVPVTRGLGRRKRATKGKSHVVV